MPKEMLPIVDKPLIQYAVEEALEAGIEEFIFVTRPGKNAIKEYFDPSIQLENFLKVPITYFYEDFPSYKAEGLNESSSTDLNYSFLVKTFSKLSESEKSKLLQILRNAVNLKETG